MAMISPGECKKCPLIELIPELVDSNSRGVQEIHSYDYGVSPSKFMKELQMNTEERLEKILKSYRKKNPNALQQQILNIEVIPHQIVFQNFKGGHVYNIIINVINVAKASCPLRVLFKSSPYFLLRYHTTQLPLKLAPGMEMQFNLQFTPEDTKDYYHQVTFISCDEKYMIPIVAIGPRPLLDLPDQIFFPDSIVHIDSSKYLLVKNLGDVPALFNIRSKLPFSVSPSSGILEANSTMQLQVTFKAPKEGTFEDTFTIRYETGEILAVKLIGMAKNAKIYLDTNIVIFDATYMGLKAKKMIHLFNNSKHIVKFKWKMLSTEQLDIEEIERIKDKDMDFKCGCGDCDCSQFSLDTNPQINLSNHTNLFCKRIHEDEKIVIDNEEKLLYFSENFVIIPLEGEIWPENDTMITIVYTPHGAKVSEEEVYCDVSGRADRLPLKLHGTGKGPLVKLNLESMDFKNVYIHTIHCFDLCVHNDGNIPATVTFVPLASEFGNIIKAKVNSSVDLEPSEYGCFTMELRCMIPGAFVDIVQFCIEQSGEIIEFTMTGVSLFPHLDLDVEEINFGDVAVGYPTTRTIKLFNNTNIEIPFKVFMESDGTAPRLMCEEFFKNTKNCLIYEDPKEYKFTPESGLIAARSSAEVIITLVSNKYRAKELSMSVQVWGSADHALTIPVKHCSLIPKIVCFPQEINIRFCFINYPCTRTLKIENQTGLYSLMQIFLNVSDGNYMNVVPDIDQIYMKPYEKIKISLDILVTSLGTQTATLEMMFFGGMRVPLCNITCFGQGPVVSVVPEILNFKTVTLLKWVSDDIVILNDSPIPAFVDIQASTEFSINVEPNKAVLQPEESKKFTVSVYLNDTRAFKHSINIHVLDRTTIHCTILAVGVGTSIAVEPPFADFLDLGPVLTKQRMSKKFTFRNKGVRFHKILVGRKEIIKTMKDYEEIESVFQIYPNIFTLKPNEEVTLEITAHCNNPRVIEEDFYVHAVIENLEKKQIIMRTIMRAEFVKPMLKFSTKSMYFRTDYGVEGTVAFVRDKLQFTNKSKLSLQILMKVKAPFYIFKNEELYNELCTDLLDDDSEEIEVYFNSIAEDKHSFIACGSLEFSYVGHPHIDRVYLKGDVNYPNVIFKPDFVDFGCITTGSYTHFNVELQNVSPLPVWFTWEWSESESYFYKLPPFEEPNPPISDSQSRYSLQTSGISESEILFAHLHEEEQVDDKKKNKKEKNAKDKKKDKKGKKDADSKSKSTKISKSSNTETKKSDSKSKKSDKKEKKGKGKKEPKVANPLPFEVIYQNYYIETYRWDHEILITLLFIEPITMWHLVTEINEECAKNCLQMRKKLLPPCYAFYKEEILQPITNGLPEYLPDADEITTLLELVPFHGYLLPYESQIINLSFHRVKDMYIRVRALCNVLEGPTQYLDIVGTSSDIHYCIDTTFVDFHRQVFCEVCQKNIKLTNTGSIPFTFDTTATGEPEMEHSGHLLELGWLTVQPRSGILEPNTTIDLMIRYFPGIAGKFLENFQLEIGFLPPITITVSGYGVFPQVYLSIPRPAMFDLPVMLCYEAIAAITPDFLVYVEDIKVWCHPEELPFEIEIPKKERKALKRDGWVIISHKMEYPAAMDIDLAIERMMACKHILQNPLILADHLTLQKTKCIPHFFIPPYFVDFGYVITENLVHYTILVLNYGPTDVQIRLIQNLQKSGILDAGFTIQFNPGRLRVGETCPVHIIFFAPIDKYTERLQILNYSIYLEVAHGPRIPINIQAAVTIPYLEIDTDTLEFGEVLCGQCKMMNFIMRNKGYLTCHWKARLEEVKKKPKKYKEKIISEPCMFYLRTVTGTMEPNDEFLFDIFFEPQKSIIVDWRLIINVENNPEDFVVKLKGEGLQPHLKIEDLSIEYEAALPFSTNSVKILKIENPCTFPIEFYFSDFDEQIYQEEKLLRLLCQYYSSDDLYIPPRLPGVDLPKPLYKFQEDIMDELVIDLKNQEREREERERELLFPEQYAAEKKAAKKKGKSIATDHSGDKDQRLFSNILEGKTPEEVETLIIEYINVKLEKMKDEDVPDYYFRDPIKSAIMESKAPFLEIDTSGLKEGIAIIFHGGPFTDYIYSANKLGRTCNLPVINLDPLIIDALVTNITENCVTINDLINEAYNNSLEPNLETDEIDMRTVIEKPELDAYEELEMKINTIIEKLSEPDDNIKKQGKSGSAKESKKSASSKSSAKQGDKKKGKSKGPDMSDTLVSIPQDMLIDAIKQKLLEYPNGFVIEHLKSNFLRKPMIALNCILKAIGNTKFIQGVLFYNSYELYEEMQEKLKEEQLKKAEEDKIAKCKYFDEITDEELHNLTEEDMELYKNEYIAKRKEATAIRLKALQDRKESSRATQHKSKVIKSNIKIKRLQSAVKSHGDVKIKRDRSSVKKSGSSLGSKKFGKKQKLTPEEQAIIDIFASFEAEFYETVHIFEYWDRRSCSLTQPFDINTKIRKNAKNTPKKGKTSKTSKVASSLKSMHTMPKSVTRVITDENPVGISFWIIPDSGQDENVVNIAPNIIQSCQEYLKARASLYEFLTPKLETNSELFSVVHRPTENRINSSSDVFVLKLLDVSREASKRDLNSISDKEAIESASGSTKTRKSLFKRRKSSISSKSKMNRSLSKQTSVKFSTRYILNAGESIQFQIEFLPKALNTFEFSYPIEIVGWNTKYFVDLKAVCDVPKIDMDPIMMFPTVVDSKIPANLFDNNIFVRDVNEFNFGNILLDDTTQKRTTFVETAFQLKNVSSINAEVTVYIGKKSDVFEIQPKHLFIAPNESEFLVINASPAFLGPNKNTIFIAIKDNPKVEIIHLDCNGCELKYEISAKKLVFERVQVNTRMRKTLIISNNSLVPFSWKIKNFNDFSQKYLIVPMHGYIKPFHKMNIAVSYMSEKVEEVPKKKLEIQIFDEFNKTGSVLSDFVELSAEACLLQVMCNSHCDFADVKCINIYEYVLPFTNNGKYTVFYEITKVNTENLDKKIIKILGMFQINNVSGSLPSHKTVNTIVTFTPNRQMKIKDLPVYKCVIFDNIDKQVHVLQTFFITATAQTYYSNFEIHPLPTINFGYMLVGTPIKQNLLIKNTGKFEFDYNILSAAALETLKEQLATKSEKKGKGKSSKNLNASSKGSKSESRAKLAKSSSKLSSKTGKNSKGSKKFEKLPAVQYGNFNVTNFLGTIEPNESKTITVQCFVKNVETIEDKLFVFISESESKYSSGIPINIIANGSVPDINFTDYQNIFKDQYTVKNYTDYVKPKEIKEHAVFVSEPKCIVFNNVCINTTFSTKIYLHNSSLVSAEVTTKISPSDFSISPDKFEILPYSDGAFEISFSPIKMQMYTGSLDMNLTLPGNFKPQAITYKLMGDGRVPEISILEPESVGSEVKQIIYNPTLAGKSTNRSIVIENTGDFPCKSIIEISNSKNDVFSLILDDVIPLLNYYDESEKENMRYQTTINLIPGQRAHIVLNYTPKKVGADSCKVKLHIMYNPFETFVINVVADCFTEDIIFDGLQTLAPIKPKKLATKPTKPDIDAYCTNYLIDFGNSFLNSLQKTRFKIVNQSEVDVYKFEFRTLNDIVFIPSVGHLKPGAKKEVIVTFLSSDPITYKQLALQCTTCKIEYMEEEVLNEYVNPLKIDDISWDERQQLVLFDDTMHDMNLTTSMSSKTSVTQTSLLELNTEPTHTVIQNTFKFIPILLSAISGYSTYRCDTASIHFRDTFMFEKRLYHFILYNPGDINLEIKWDISISEDYRKRVNSEILRNDNSDENVILRPNSVVNLRKPNYCNKGFPRPLSGNENIIGQTRPESRKSINITETDYTPFVITPTTAKILPKETFKFTILFSPLDVYEYKVNLKGSIPNLSPAQKNIDIEIKAKSIMPYCHFDVKFSDYLTNGKRTVEKCEELDVNAKVIEFDCLGVGIAHKKSFNIINPTEEDLSFVWKQLNSHEIASVSLFHCQNPIGFINCGRQFEMTFSILPHTIGTYEALYSFKIEKYDVQMQFLLVANVREPDVYFLNSHLQMKPTVIGINVIDYVILKNEEDEILDFKFKTPSLYSEGRRQSLAVEPKKGILPKHGDCKIKINYSPTEYGETYFKLKCNVTCRKLPVCLDVSTTCYEVQPLVTYSLFSGRKISLSSESDNFIDLGSLIPNHTEMIKVYIRNGGKLGFYFQWVYNDDIIDRVFHIELSGKEGYVKTDTEISNCITITPMKCGKLKNFKILLKVRYGPSYKLYINGISTKNLFKFTFTKYNFGPCFLQNGATIHYSKVLEFTNFGNNKLTLDCVYTNNEYLTVDYKIKEIAPKTKDCINIYFHPQKCQKYNDEVIFFINSQEVKINIQGEGIRLNIMLENPQDKCVDLGSPLIEEKVKKIVKVVNKSSAVVKAVFDIWDRLPFYMFPPAPKTHHVELPLKPRKSFDSKIFKKDKKNEKITAPNKKDTISKCPSSKATEGSGTSIRSKSILSKTKLKKCASVFADEDVERNLVKSAITVLPKEGVTILPNKSAEFVIHFTPKQRMKPFMEKISMQIYDTVQPLCVMKGTCIGLEFNLDRYVIPFGTVVLNCQRETKLLLMNTGDIGAKFDWTISSTSDFTIFPVDGYSSPGMTITFSVKFHPSKLDYQFNMNIYCNIEGLEAPLCVKLNGNCIDLPEASGIIQFVCPVRTKDQKNVALQNNTGHDWKLYPTITGDYFSTDELFVVPAKATRYCYINYEPLTMMTTEFHKGFIFFKLPDGTGLLYDLLGKSDPPLPVKKLNIDVPSKCNHTVDLLVENWLRKPQKLQVRTEDITPGNVVNLYHVKGKDILDLQSESNRDYQWNFYAYKECNLEFKVIFSNEENEYLFYIIYVKVIKCKPTGLISMSTCVRTSVFHNLTLPNPLEKPTTFTMKCNVPDIICPKLPITIKPNSEDIFTIEYKPLLPGETRALLEAASFELGTYPFEFYLTAFPALPEPPRYISCVLGEVAVINVPIKNFSKSKTSFTCQIPEDSSFGIDNTTIQNVSSDQTFYLLVKYDPCILEDTNITLIVSSPNAGEYVYNLFGKCLPPKPKGPFILKLNKEVSVNFRNPFKQTQTFKISVEPEIFTLPVKEVTIDSKMACNIAVQMQNSEILMEQYSNSGYLITGKMVIYCKNPSLAHVKWNYYLNGVM